MVTWTTIATVVLACTPRTPGPDDAQTSAPVVPDPASLSPAKPPAPARNHPVCDPPGGWPGGIDANFYVQSANQLLEMGPSAVGPFEVRRVCWSGFQQTDQTNALGPMRNHEIRSVVVDGKAILRATLLPNGHVRFEPADHVEVTGISVHEAALTVKDGKGHASAACGLAPFALCGVPLELLPWDDEHTDHGVVRITHPGPCSGPMDLALDRPVLAALERGGACSAVHGARPWHVELRLLVSYRPASGADEALAVAPLFLEADWRR